MKEWSNLARIVYKRTYSRKDGGTLEDWNQTVERTIMGNVKGKNVPEQEVKELIRLANERKAGPAGRGYWFSGSPAHDRIGGNALNNCWYFTADDWNNFVIAQDLLMLGGGVGLSVEHQFVSKLPKVKKDVHIEHKATKDADFIVPDSREGWCELTRRVLEAFFVTGKSFTYSTICVRGYGEPIVGFGGTASGPIPLLRFVTNLYNILNNRAGKSVRPIDAADIITATGELVVAGNVRRSAILVQGDCWDKEYLKAKRWDLSPLPTYRSCANYSVVCEDVDDLHPLFWKTYEQGEPFGIVNRKSIQTYGRMGELKPDNATGVNPCAEATLENGEPCVAGYTPLIHKGGIGTIESLVGKPIEIWNGYKWSLVVPRLTGTGRELYRVKLGDGSYLDCTANHSWSVKTRFNHSFSKKRTDELFKSRYPLQIEPTVIVNENTLTLDDAYTLGIAVGDGGVDGRYSLLYLYGSKIDLPLSGVRRKLEEKSDHNTLLQRVRTDISTDLLSKLKNGLGDDLNWLFKFDRKSLLEFIAGWIDADGSETGTGGVRLYISKECRARRAQLLLSLCGIKSSVNLMQRAGEKTNYSIRNKDMWYLQITECSEIPCRRVSTSGGHKPKCKGKYQTVVSVEKLTGEHNTYCFDEQERHMGVFANVLTYQCNLTEMALCNMDSEEEFVQSARLMQRYSKRVTLEHYTHEISAKVISRNRRTGNGITGCLAAPHLFNPTVLDRAYAAIQDEDEQYSKELGIPRSKRTTVVKPSGTMSKVLDCMGYEGIHAAYSRYAIQRVRFASNDPLIPKLKAAGHFIEPIVKFDGSIDPSTLVADFYVQAPDGCPVADEDWDTWKQLEILKMAQKHWADQSVSVTVYYKREDIPKLKEWLRDNLAELKTISFLCHNDHGFKQAPKEAITEEQYTKLSSKIKPLEIDEIAEGDMVEGLECEGGVCPVR